MSDVTLSRPTDRSDLEPTIAAAIDKFTGEVDAYLAGRIDEDVFRLCRLNNGVYGQRQGGHNQMVRIKVPYGSIQPEQLEMLAHVAEIGRASCRERVYISVVGGL